MFIIDFANFIFSLILAFLTIVIFHPINKYKKIKSKEEQLFLQKILLSSIFFILVIVISIFFVFEFMDSKTLFVFELLVFNAYIISIVLYNFFLSYELYFTFMNPVHYFNRLFKQKKYNYVPEFIILLAIILVFGLDFIFYHKEIYKFDIKTKKDEDKPHYFCDDSIIFILIGGWKSFIIIILSISSLVFLYLLNSKIQKFCFKSQEKLYNLISRRKMSNFLYIIYGLFYFLPTVSRVEININYNIFGYIFFIIIIFNDLIIHLSIISKTKFCEYRLKRTLLQYFCSCFYNPKNYGSSSTPLVIESTLNEYTGMTTFQNETSTALDIISNNPKDKELLSTYKNGLFIEDYYFYYFDQILNILSASIFHVYNSKYFSTKANEQRLSNTFQIGGDMSSIGGTFQNLTVSNIGNNNNKTMITSNSEVGEDVAIFDIKKNMEKDELNRFKEVLESGLNIQKNNNYLDINIKSFFTQRCVESIYDQRLKGRHIASSLLSHMLLNTRKIENPNLYYYSLFSANGKEEYFTKLKNACFKTYDKNFTLDIFDTNDDEIKYTENTKDSLAILLDKYFTYIHGKGINGTFIPSLVGVFKIKINNFKTLLVFVTRNSLIENIPKNFYTYWQLIRFLNDKPQKMGSSKFSSGTLVKDDPIFERSFQIETKKENPNYNKIMLKNYLDFEETIQNDIEFLKQCGSQNFDLLLMYYEYENTQKHEKQGTIKIKKTDTGIEIIEETMPKEFLEEGTSLHSKFGSKMPDSLGGGFLSMGGDFLDDNDFGGKNKNFKAINEVDETMNIYGYEGIFDSFNCLCYFTFENIFDITKRFTLTFNYYNSFKKKVMVNFAECQNTK